MSIPNPLVSVIIGAYNVENYLKKELSCLINQSYINLEIILVNDGSTDSTRLICDRLAEKDNRIKVIHKENGGLGSARNVGLDAATGEFVWFYDVDDEADLNLVEKCVDWMQIHQVDLTIFSFYAITESSGDIEKIVIDEALATSNDQLRDIYTKSLINIKHGNGFNWNKFYRKSFIDRYNFRFDNLRIQQDEIFNIKLYPHLERVYISSEPLYHYLIVTSGNTRSRYIANRFDIVTTVHDRLISFARDWGVDTPEYIDKIQLRYFGGINSEIRFNIFHPDGKLTYSEKRERIMRVLKSEKVKETLDYLKVSPNLSFEDRLFIKAYIGGFSDIIIALNKTINTLKPLAKQILGK
ncbi:MAG: glycosyltransferase family 2 protein [Bacteroidales bacterium]